MPRTRYTLIPYRLLVALLAALCILLYVPAKARRTGQTSGAQRSASSTNNSQSAPRNGRKRITPLSSSETSEGSRLTITSDAPLNDYAASRSGDRFYVVIPQAEASAVQRGLRGRGFTDAQVQRRGNDVVLSVRLQPGASARVSQRFNRLDVIFTTPGAASTNTATNTQVANTNTTPVRNPVTNTRVETNTATQKPKEAQPTPTPAKESTANNTEERSAEPTRRNETPNATPSEVIAPTNTAALPPTSPSPAGTPAPAQSATPAPSPEQVAQARPTPATPTAISTTQSSSSAVTIGAVIARNWPFVLMAVLLLAGIGLFVGTRASARQAPATTSPPAATTGAPGGSVAAASPAAQAQPATSVAPTLPAAAPPVAPVEAKKPAAEKKVKPKKVVPKTPPLEETVPVTELEPAVPVSAERAGIEIRRLLDGENYDRAIVGTSHGPSRQLIAAELLAALAARNLERRERARTAFVEHNYFDDATHALRSAEAPAERASAARSLGLVGDRAATPHLVAALEDSSAEVRRASVEALAEIHDPAAVEPLERLREREKDQKRKVSPALIHRAIEASSAPKVIETPPPPVPEVMEATLPAPTAETPAPEMPSPDVTAAEAFAPSPAGIEEPVIEAPPAEQMAPEPVSVAEEAAAPAAIPEEEEMMLPPATATEASTAPPSLPAEESIAAVAETAPATAESVAEAPPLPSAAPQHVAESAPDESSHEIALLYESLIEPETGFETPVTPTQAQEEPPAPVTAPEPEREYPVTVADEWVELDMNEPEPHRAPPATAAAPPAPAVEEEAAPKAIEPVQWEEPVERTVAESVEITPLEEEPAEISMAEATRAIVEREAPTVGGIGMGETAEAAATRHRAGEDPQTRAAHVAELSHRDGEEAFTAVCAAFDDPAEEVRNAAARALYTIRSDRADSFTRALREATPERRRHIGAAISSSGLASEAISRLTGESRDKTYDAFSLLFLMAKAGELQPLIRAIETHPETDVRLAVVKLLALSGQHEILPAFRRLAVRGSLPTEVRAAVMEAIYQIGSQSAPDASMKR